MEHDQQHKKFFSLEGKILVASPNLGDGNFERTLIYICMHDINGAIGVILNQSIGNISEADLLKYVHATSKAKAAGEDIIDIKKSIKDKKFPILFGGPLYTDKIVVLSMNKAQEKDFDLQQSLTLYTDVKLFLDEYITKKKPKKLLFAKGIAAWDSNQLETELMENSWFVVPPSVDLLFSQKSKNKWDSVIKQLGLHNPHNLVSYIGHA